MAATEQVDLWFRNWSGGTPVGHADCALEWLFNYGQHVTSLDLGNFPQPLQQLPAPIYGSLGYMSAVCSSDQQQMAPQV